MTDKALKKLNRKELIEMLLTLKKRNEELEKELEEAKEQLSDKEIKISRAGSIAEASLALTKVFEEAQKAAELYLENVKSKGTGPTDDLKR